MADDGQHYCKGTSARSRGKRGQQKQALGRSRGGFGTKIDSSSDAPYGLWQCDYKQALRLLDKQDASFVLADKRYD